jgi:hypothetical protein
MTLLHQGSNRSTAQRRNPGYVRIPTHLVDGLLRDHSPVTHHHHPFNAELLTQACDLWHERRAVRCVALKHRNRHRAAARIGEQPVVDLQGAALAITAVAQFGQRTARALEVTRGEVVQHQRVVPQMACSEFLLNSVLSREQPVHGGVQIVLAGVSHAKLFCQGTGVPQARGGQLGGGADDARGHHGLHQIALRARLGRQQGCKAQALHGQRDSLHVTVAGHHESSALEPQTGLTNWPACACKLWCHRERTRATKWLALPRDLG